MEKHKNVIVFIILLTAIFISYAIPQAKYVGTDFIDKLKVPLVFNGWQGKDVSDALNIDAADTNFNFINESLAHNYVSREGQSLLFILLDAGNFHHPKVCFTGAGYKIKELPSTEFDTPGRSFSAHTLFTQRGQESFLSFYWIVINKKIADQWVEQKVKQLLYSMINKKRVGLMVRLDIPSREDNLENALSLARQFITEMSHTLPPEPAGYIFGAF